MVAHVPALVLMTGLLVCSSCGGGGQYYTPDRERVERMGQQNANQRLAELLTAAQGPTLYDVEVTPELVAFRCQPIALQATSRHGGRSSEVRSFECPDHVVQLRFLDIARIEILRPEYILTLRDADQIRVFRLQYTSQDQALELVDLWAWFRSTAAQAAAAPPLIVELTRDAAPFTYEPGE